jgi:hypothetical protein
VSDNVICFHVRFAYGFVCHTLATGLLYKAYQLVVTDNETKGSDCVCFRACARNLK